MIGLCCAHYLLERGHQVTLIERGPHDHDCCSLGNAGYVSPSHFIPLAAPGIIGQALRWMGNPESPFYVRPRFDLELLAWGWRFWRASTGSRARRAGPLLRDLNLASRALYVELAELAGNEFELALDGLLMLFRSESALEMETNHAARARELGMPAEVLDARGVARLEPDLTLDALGGVYYPLDAHLAPQRLHATLSRLVGGRGGVFLWNAEVLHWNVDDGAVRSAITSQGVVAADEFVVAAGSWSSRLIRPLGLALPIQPGKGYSLTLNFPPEQPRRSVLLQEARVAITPLGTCLRVGGTMELGTFDLSITESRIRGIVRSVSRYLPSFHPKDFDGSVRWCGLRPCSPDGLPFVGRFPRFRNLAVATGHAMLGLSMAPITGTLVAELLSGEAPSIDLSLLRPDRFNS